LFMVGGLLYQSHYHGGLLESGPILFKKNAAKSAASEKPLGGKIEEQTSSDGSASYAKPVPVETKPVHSPSPARSYSKFEDIPPKEFPSPASEPITPLPAAASARVAPPSPAFSSVSTTSEESSADDAKLKFGTFTRVPEAPSPSAAPGELKINMAEGKPEVRRPDPNSKMKRADDFDD